MASASISGVASSIIGGPYSYIRVLHHSFLLKAIVFLWFYGSTVVKLAMATGPAMQSFE